MVKFEDYLLFILDLVLYFHQLELMLFQNLCLFFWLNLGIIDPCHAWLVGLVWKIQSAFFPYVHGPKYIDFQNQCASKSNGIWPKISLFLLLVT